MSAFKSYGEIEVDPLPLQRQEKEVPAAPPVHVEAAAIRDTDEAQGQQGARTWLGRGHGADCQKICHLS